MTRRVAAVVVAALAVAGCRERDAAVTMWHAYTKDERAALETWAADWNRREPGRRLELVAMPYDGFADKLGSAIPNGNGPDLFIYAQDRLGDWSAAGVVEPIEFWIDDATAGRFSREALASLAYRDSLWGLPIAVKSLALYVRTELVPTPPTTTDELIALAPGLRARGIYPLAYPVADLYAHAPWLHGFGGRAMDGEAPTIATAPAVAAAAFARELVVREVIPPDANTTGVATLFADGKAAMAVSGPWFLADIPPGVAYQVAPLPVVSATGAPAAPYLGTDGVLMSARATDKDAAIAVMLDLTSDDAAAARASTARQIVPNPGAYRGALGRDPVLAGFRRQLDHVVAMPVAPAMRSVWTPYANALAEIAGGAAPAAALERAAGEIDRYTRRGSGR
ncbi:MAG: extracellular solute-binding protein [Kofleriaceae bacterium]|jgi:arabinogalactan oligomer/maltooligosaccharide transport system substrate-binding protein|nr:extracellular solute-binding protein [Kofleriaceae bacterium]MBP9169179.1 extracellular solute-binding protein [Kofleriaceae bacterium]MBP9857872.1 extracellular solute-binding protein [Kofleriaceae bacterium]